MAKISTFIISMLFVSLFVATLGYFMGGINASYDLNYDNTTFDNYDKLNDITATTEEIKDKTENIEDKGVLDIIGGYFSSAYSAIKLTGQSFGFFSDVADEGLKDVGLPPFFKAIVYTMMLVFIFIACLLAYILKTQT